MTTFDGSAQPIGRYAELLHVTSDTVRRAIQRGALEGYFDGQRWFVSAKAFAAARLSVTINNRRDAICRQICNSPILDRNGRAVEDIAELNQEIERRVLGQLRAEFPDLEDYQLLDGFYEMGSAAALASPTFGRGRR